MNEKAPTAKQWGFSPSDRSREGWYVAPPRKAAPADQSLPVLGKVDPPPPSYHNG